jgi:CRISPR-associated endoribonuclease Cas6
MRIKVTFQSKEPIVIPRQYQHLLQGLIYHLIQNQEVQDFLHNEGFQWEKRRFKPFSFSWLQGKYEVKNHAFHFLSPSSFYISSNWQPFMEALVNSLVKTTEVRLGSQMVRVDEVGMLPTPEFQARTLIHTLSPITMYSTLETAERRKVTHYYEMWDKQFSELIRKNLVKKAQAVLGEDLGEVTFSLTPIGIKSYDRLKTISYKSQIIKGWVGTFVMEGDQRLQRIAYDMGLGGKNGIGMGCIELNNAFQ